MPKLKDEPVRIKYISKKNCFLHVPDKILRNLMTSAEMCVKIQYGKSNVAYVSWYNQPYNSDDGQYVGLNATYAKMLGIKDEEEVLLSTYTNAYSVSKVNVHLLTFEEWDIMESNIHAVQSSLLDQVRVVWSRQILPVWVSKYLHFTVRVDIVEPTCQVGVLHQYTDLGVILPNEEAKAEADGYGNTHNLDSDDRSSSRVHDTLVNQYRPNSPTMVEHTDNQSSSTNIWNTVKGIFSHDLSVTSAQQEKRLKGCYSMEDINSEFNNNASHALFRVHPLPRLIVKTEPITRNDALLYHPFNVFIHRSNLPSPLQTMNYIICKITMLTFGKVNEKHVKRTKDERNELPDLAQPSKENSSKSTFARVICIEDVCDKLSPELKEKFKKAASYSQHQCVLVPDTILRTLNLKTSSRINLLFQRYERKCITSLKLTPCGKWNLDRYIIENMCRDLLLRLSAGAPVILSSNSHLNLSINSAPIGDVMVQILPEGTEYAVLDEVTVARCKIDVAEVCSLDTNILPEDDNHSIASSMFHFGSHVQHLIDEGLSTLKMSLLLEPSPSSWVLHHLKTELISNILILGRLGSGKTTLAQYLCKMVAKEPYYTHCVAVQCKRLKGKKVDTLQKMVMEWVSECIFHQPSVLVLDDIDAIAGTATTEEHTAEEAYFFRIGDMLTNILHGVQCRNYVVIIATAPSVTKLSRSITAARGQHFFNVLLDIPELSKNDRLETMKSVISGRTGLSDDTLQSLDLESHAAKAEGYVVQDIVDLVDKAVFQGWKRMCSRPHSDHRDMALQACDMMMAMKNNIPLSLRGVTLHKDSTQTWADVGGLTEVKQQLIEVLQWPSQYMDLFAKCPLRHQSGLLLYGAPGTGKTLLAAAVSHECGLNFISIKGPELLSKYIGASEEAVRNIFQKAQSARPCVLFFDEFDSLAPRRGHDSTGVTDRVVNQLLTQLDGVESLTGVWVVAATSRPDLLDPALLRPGRLDKTIFCPLPNAADRKDILRALTQKLTLASDVDLEEIAKKSDGFTGADLQAVLYTSQLMAVENQQKVVSAGGHAGSSYGDGVAVVTQEHLLAALADTRPSLSPQEKMRYQRIYNAFIGSRKGKARSLTEVSQRATLA